MSGAEIKITFLGTGSTIPPNDRQQVSFALRHSDGLIIFDCGEGTQYSLRRYKVSTRKEIVICISHLHADHFLGLPGLLSSMELLDREDEIKIIGPKGIALTIENLLKANYLKITYPITAFELGPGEAFEGNNYVIKAIKADHNGRALSYMFIENDIPGNIILEKTKELRIPEGPLLGKLQQGLSIEIEGKLINPQDVMTPDKPGRKVIYSGDTAYNEKLAETIPENADILVHEATYPSDREDLANERQHSTIQQAAEIAKLANVQELYLTHLSPRIEDYDGQLEIAKSIFNNTKFAFDGMEVVIPFPKN